VKKSSQLQRVFILNVPQVLTIRSPMTSYWWFKVKLVDGYVFLERLRDLIYELLEARDRAVEEG